MNSVDFDRIILSNLKEKYPDSFGYHVASSGKEYDTYYNNTVFSAFIQDMKSKNFNHYKQYDKGKGSELKEKSGVPPKMACVGSSSRFCYIALNNVNWKEAGFKGVPEFEYPCKIDGIRGTPPQLDAYFKESNTYFEVKCHEIFEEYSITLAMSYWNLIFGKDNDFGLEASIRDNENNKTFTISLDKFGFDKGKKKSMFYIKQLLCHLLGIKYNNKNNGRQKAELIYLFFIPKCKDIRLSNEVNQTFSNLKKEIITIFSSNPIKLFCERNNITLTAMAERSNVMESLSDNNTEIIYNDRKLIKP